MFVNWLYSALTSIGLLRQQRLKFLIAGPKGAGKTTLLLAFTENRKGMVAPNQYLGLDEATFVTSSLPN